MHTVLVIGGYGFFGAQICAALARNPAVRVLIAGRDQARCRRLAEELGLAPAQAVHVDAESPALPQVLARLRVGTVIHTAGPFQGQDYTVARASISAGCHYIDLADGRQFVTGIEALDAAAKARGVMVTSGASSLPALSSAVVEHFVPQFARLDSIRIGISSGARVPGLATVRGVFSYAGKPIRTLQEGSYGIAYGWRGLERHRFPRPVGRRWLASCEVPDLDLLPRRFPTVRTVTFKAGFASDAGHLLVWALAGLVRAGLAADIVALAAPLKRLSRLVEPLLSARGGMFVALQGVGIEGRLHRVTWNLLAGHNHGPFIPCGASIALANKIAQGRQLPRGALPCMGLITLADYLRTLGGLDVAEVIEY